MLLSIYSRFVARWPWINLVLVFMVVAVCGALAFFLVDEDDRPDFAEPTEGFETRGTTISGAIRTWQKMYDEVNAGKLTFSPPYIPFDMVPNPDGTEDTTFGEVESTRGATIASTDEPPGGVILQEDLAIDDWCLRTIEGNPRVVFEGKRNRNLLSVDVMHEICDVDTRYLQPFSDLRGEVCPGWSLGGVVGILTGKTCSEITDADVEVLVRLLHQCAPPYLKSENAGGGSCEIAYKVFYYLVDKDFVQQLAEETDDILAVSPRYTQLVGSGFWYDDQVLDVYMDSLDGATSDDFTTVEIVGIYLGDNKFDLFNEYLLQDIVYFVLAIGLILIVMCLYLRSVAITIATIFNVLFSFILAYFFYYIVCRFKYFPFLNVLSGLILIAVGADDVFIFVDVWQQERRKLADDGDSAKLAECLYRTLHHALASIFVTSFTTAAAFFSNVVSDITAVRCFGIFSGLAILANFVLMVTWVPAVVVLLEKTTRYCCKGSGCSTESAEGCKGTCSRVLSMPSKAFSYVFDHTLPTIVSKVWFIWLVIFTAVGIAGVVLVFVTPKLELPTSDSFQLFPSKHPLEQYDMKLKKHFSYEDRNDEEGGDEAIIAWGVKGVDNGDHYNPDDYGHIEYDDQFDLSTPEAQAWMLSFCDRLLNNASFVSEDSRNSECILKRFFDLVPEQCASFPKTYHECCAHGGQPVSSETFSKCFPAFISYEYMYRYTYSLELQYNQLETILFDQEGKLRVYAFEFQTNQPFQTGYNDVRKFYRTMWDFIQDAKKDAPKEVKGIWLAGSFDFYDLQRALSSGTYIAIGVSLGVALLVMFLTSLNVLLSIYAIINIGFSISVTVGILVLLGWELNVLESVAISISVGLSIDFAIHYSVGYRLCDNPSPPARVRESLARVGPAISMAALTTFLAGAAIMGTRILAYIQLGTFLMLVMVVSWLFATFFFLALCSIAGPRGNCAQVKCPPGGGKTSPEPGAEPEAKF